MCIFVIEFLLLPRLLSPFYRPKLPPPPHKKKNCYTLSIHYVDLYIDKHTSIHSTDVHVVWITCVHQMSVLARCLSEEVMRVLESQHPLQWNGQEGHKYRRQLPEEKQIGHGTATFMVYFIIVV